MIQLSEYSNDLLLCFHETCAGALYNAIFIKNGYARILPTSWSKHGNC